MGTQDVFAQRRSFRISWLALRWRVHVATWTAWRLVRLLPRVLGFIWLLSIIVRPISHFQSCRLLFSRTIRQSSWRVKLAPLVSYIVITAYCVLAIMRFLVVTRDVAVDYHFVKCFFRLSSRVVFIPLLKWLQTLIHDYGFYHLIDSSFSEYASSCVAVQRLAKVYWPPYNTDDRWCDYLVNSGSVHDLFTGVVKKHKRDANGNVVTI